MTALVDVRTGGRPMGDWPSPWSRRAEAIVERGAPDTATGAAVVSAALCVQISLVVKLVVSGRDVSRQNVHHGFVRRHNDGSIRNLSDELCGQSPVQAPDALLGEHRRQRLEEGAIFGTFLPKSRPCYLCNTQPFVVTITSFARHCPRLLAYPLFHNTAFFSYLLN